MLTVDVVHDAGIALFTIATVITLCRLAIRVHDGLLCWDDFWASFSIASGALMLTGVLIITHPTASMSQLTVVTAYYLADTGFYACVWSSRFSILCTIKRITPTYDNWLRAMATAFFAMWLFLTTQAIVHCEKHPEWKTTTLQCPLGKNVAIAQLTTAIFTDLILCLTPARMIWYSDLPMPQRVRLIIVFSTCLLTTVASLAHAYCIWFEGYLDQWLAAAFETSVSMVVASMSVIVSFAFRLALMWCAPELADSSSRGDQTVILTSVWATRDVENSAAKKSNVLNVEGRPDSCVLHAKGSQGSTSDSSGSAV
ncbi:uncharacterized protein SCHCODRAFT_02622693 [Schizophyllum commune H4-8]|uniref:uncharacterized protein n=1 Tax=Schizophyllum commune (strain H4-8 / FGSC 9210) TaxID=578458 RepID=UPI00215E6221|nr:uncharacterized protein SCHCODRAFT_02622693 [Schizophyllum commune H4-8]KAI5893760.1 hypothetical protein SCHCODRAFT_02622693 [Schizophyllum commune H4-8]